MAEVDSGLPGRVAATDNAESLDRKSKVGANDGVDFADPGELGVAEVVSGLPGGVVATDNADSLDRKSEVSANDGVDCADPGDRGEAEVVWTVVHGFLAEFAAITPAIIMRRWAGRPRWGMGTINVPSGGRLSWMEHPGTTWRDPSCSEQPAPRENIE